MKLCMLISSLSSGGAERVAMTLANFWAQAGRQITVITLAGEERDFYELAPGVKRLALNCASDSRGLLSAVGSNFKRVRVVRRALLHEQPDVALAFMPSANILCGLACVGTGISAVGSVRAHPPMQPLNRSWAVLRRAIYPRLAAVSTLTEATADWIKAHTRARNVTVIPNPVAYPLPHRCEIVEPEPLMQSLGSTHNLLAVGRLVHQKGFDRLLDAFAVMHQRHSDWRLVILGEGPKRAALEKKREQLGLTEVVALPGAVHNVGAWYAAAEAYVLTSRCEGFPNTLLEALAYGLPAVAVDCETGPRDILRHEIDGLLVTQDEPQALIDALNRLAGDPELRARCADRAIEARDRFAVPKIAATWEALFQHV